MAKNLLACDVNGLQMLILMHLKVVCDDMFTHLPSLKSQILTLLSW